MTIKWHRTLHGKWVRAHRDGDPTHDPSKHNPPKDLETPAPPTTERLTIQPLPGLQALEEKYAAELERGRQLRSRFE